MALWNLALDENAGPHLGGCGNCRGVITINSATGFVTRNVEYYALGHASQFVRPGAHRIASSTNVGGLQSVAFKNADDGSKVLIVLNTASAQVPFAIHASGKAIRYSIPGSAVVTFRWMCPPGDSAGCRPGRRPPPPPPFPPNPHRPNAGPPPPWGLAPRGRWSAPPLFSA